MFETNRVLVVVPARGGSKGIKLKNLQQINGIPLVGWVGKVLKQLSFVDRAIVSTDHSEIAHISEQWGIDVPFLRPSSLAGDVVSDWEVLQHALRSIEEIDQKQYDIVVMLQPTSPLRRPEHVTATVEKLVNEDHDAVWTVSPTDSKYHPLKQLCLRNGLLEFYDQRGESIIARQQLDQLYYRNGVAYATTRKCILDMKSIWGRQLSSVIIDEPMVSIDTEFDLQIAEELMNGRSVIEQ